jgi:alkylhydroperoxidase family enzyme
MHGGQHRVAAALTVQSHPADMAVPPRASRHVALGHHGRAQIGRDDARVEALQRAQWSNWRRRAALKVAPVGCCRFGVSRIAPASIDSSSCVRAPSASTPIATGSQDLAVQRHALRLHRDPPDPGRGQGPGHQDQALCEAGRRGNAMSTLCPTTFEEPRLDVARLARPAYRAMAALDSAVELDSGLRDLVSLRAFDHQRLRVLRRHAHAGRARPRRERAATSRGGNVARGAVLQRAALRLTDEITLVAATHVPRGAFDAAHEQFPGEELALIVINAWNRLAVATRMRPGE